MSNENTPEIQTPETDTQVNATDGLDQLKARADKLGITYAKNISATALAAKITAALGEPEEEAEAVDAETAHILEATKLIRVIVTPLDGNKASQLEYAEFTAGNAVVPYVSRVVPFGREWHIEQILLDSIKGKTFQQFTTRKNSRGISVTTSKRVPAYQVTVLPALTPAELKDLADQQARTGSLEED